ncbi:MAG: hypothetical protein E6Q36_01710 [Chryseobacterium sp.]|nr:MAG: hypothetical protein E6Q36_01710 [Chryseobacterium sp.]
MAPSEGGVDQTLTSNTPDPTNSDCCNKVRWWPLWLLGGLILLFLIMIIILRGLCTDVWYINLLKLNDKLCETSGVSTDGGRQFQPGLSLEGNSLTIEGGNTITLPVKEGPEGKEGPKGSTGAQGSTGAKGENGATGPTGPAGPTDPCVTSGTYFCQNGNNYGTLAVLGTNDAQDLQVVTGGVNSALFDTSGNLTLNALESSGAPANTIAPTAFGNFLINENLALGSSVLGASTSNFFALQDSTVTDVAASQATIINSTVLSSSMLNGVITDTTVTDSIGFTGYISGGSVTSSYGLNGRFDSTDIIGSADLLGGFSGSTVSSSSGILAQLGASTMTGVSNSIVYLTNGSIANSNNSLINVDGIGSSFDNVDYSVVIGQNDLVVTDAYESTIMGSNNVVTNISSSAVLGTSNTASNLDRVTVNGIAVDISDSNNSSLVGFVVNATDLSWSNINSFASSLDTVGWSDLRVNSSDLTNVNQFGGYIQGGSVLTNVQVGTANIGHSNVSDTGGLFGIFPYANINNSTNLYGTFGGFCDGENPDDPPFGCNLGYDIQFDIDNSDGLHGSARWVDVYDSSRLFVQAGSTDPLVFSGTINNAAYGLLVVRDSDIIDSNFSSIIGDNLDITGLNYSSYIGQNSTIDASADPSFDYSYLGSDSAGNINTRINSKGDNSWLNLSGGSVGVGTNTPGGVAASGNLETTGGIRVGALDAATATNVCIDVDGDLSACSSSERYKENIQDLGLGLDTIMSLRAVSFDWKGTGQNDFGFVAEEVAALNGLLATYNKDGEVQGVKYDQLTAILTNAIQEQQGKLDGINTQLAEQGLRVDSLTEDLKALAGRVDQHDEDIKQLRDEVSELKKLIKNNTTQPAVTSQP